VAKEFRKSLLLSKVATSNKLTTTANSTTPTCYAHQRIYTTRG